MSYTYHCKNWTFFLLKVTTHVLITRCTILYQSVKVKIFEASYFIYSIQNVQVDLGRQRVKYCEAINRYIWSHAKNPTFLRLKLGLFHHDWAWAVICCRIWPLKLLAYRLNAPYPFIMTSRHSIQVSNINI